MTTRYVDPEPGPVPPSQLEVTEAALRAAQEENERLKSAVRWALGEIGNFGPRPEGKGAYWWRDELRHRAFYKNDPYQPPRTFPKCRHAPAPAVRFEQAEPNSAYYLCSITKDMTGTYVPAARAAELEAALRETRERAATAERLLRALFGAWANMRIVDNAEVLAKDFGVDIRTADEIVAFCAETEKE